MASQNSINNEIRDNNLIIGGSLIANSGIDFGGANNLFEDYEQGVWTPVLSFGGSSVGLTYANRVGYYIRIGNIVHIECNILLSNTGTSTGVNSISGLPFPIGFGSSQLCRFTNSPVIPLSVYINVVAVTGGDLEIRSMNSGDSLHLTHANFGNNTMTQFGLFYFI